MRAEGWTVVLESLEEFSAFRKVRAFRNVRKVFVLDGASCRSMDCGTMEFRFYREKFLSGIGEMGQATDLAPTITEDNTPSPS